MGKKLDSLLGKGKKLDSLLGKGFKTSKFKATTNMAISRLAVLKNQRQSRCSIARSDVVEFLTTGKHDRALFRVEQVIKEQNMLDVFNFLEGYCHLLIERIHLIEQEKVCPEELKEAVSSLTYAATRCGEFPELQEIRLIFTSRFGKDFANRAIELRNNCSVNLKIVQKLSTRMPSMVMKMEVLKEIASDNNIVLQIEDTVSATIVENQHQHNGIPSSTEVSYPREDYSDSSTRRRKYRDVADAAQAAFESAAYAAAAARAAVELSRSESTDPDHPTSPRKGSGTIGLVKDKVEEEQMQYEVKFEKIHPNQDYGAESKQGSVSVVKRMEKFGRDDNKKDYRRSLSSSSSNSGDSSTNKMKLSYERESLIKPPAREVIFDESESGDEEESRKPEYSAYRNSPLRSGTGLKMESGLRNFTAENRNPSIEPLNINRRPISVRSRWTRGG